MSKTIRQIDLRSDTVTRPSAAMVAALSENGISASVGPHMDVSRTGMDKVPAVFRNYFSS